MMEEAIWFKWYFSLQMAPLEQCLYHYPLCSGRHNLWHPLQHQRRCPCPRQQSRTRGQPQPKRLPQLLEGMRGQQNSTHLQNLIQSLSPNPTQTQIQKQRRRKLDACCTARSAKWQSTQRHSWRLTTVVRGMCCTHKVCTGDKTYRMYSSSEVFKCVFAIQHLDISMIILNLFSTVFMKYTWLH